jgi:hypothetical protein
VLDTKIVARFDKNNELFIQDVSKIYAKEVVPKKQLYGLYALNKINRQ